METITDLYLAYGDQSVAPAPMKHSYGKLGIRILSLLMGCAITGLTQSVMAQTVLSRGSSGQAVSELQSRLQELGCYDGSITGFFGEQTEAGVIQCQQRFGVEADGVVGSETYTALGLGGNPVNSEPVNSEIGAAQAGDRLQLGDLGSGVADLQTQLQARGYYYGPIDGIFGADTQTAVIGLQRDSNLPQTGVANAQVSAVLNGGSPSLPVAPFGTVNETVDLRVGDQGSRVVALQQQLNRQGYPVQADGYFGTGTEVAVRRFQQATLLPVTGVADAQTLNQIGLGGGRSVALNPRRYAVVIPIPNPDALRQVQQVIPDAVPRQSRLGDFVRAGVYTTPEAAERSAETLRSRGLPNVRVVFE